MPSPVHKLIDWTDEKTKMHLQIYVGGCRYNWVARPSKVSVWETLLWLLIPHCCSGPEDRLHYYMSFIQIPVRYFSYDILQTLNEDSLKSYTDILTESQ